MTFFIDIYNEHLFDKKFVLMTHLAASNDKESISNHEQFKAFEENVLMQNSEFKSCFKLCTVHTMAKRYQKKYF